MEAVHDVELRKIGQSRVLGFLETAGGFIAAPTRHPVNMVVRHKRRLERPRNHVMHGFQVGRQRTDRRLTAS